MSTFFISNHHSFAGAEHGRRDSNGLEVRARCRETRSRTGRGGADLDLGGRNRHARKSRKERAKRGRVSNLRFRQRSPCSVRGTRWITPDTASRHADTVASLAASAVLSDVSRVCTSVSSSSRRSLSAVRPARRSAPGAEERAVERILGPRGLVGTFGHYRAAVEHDDARGETDRLRSVRDQQRRAADHEPHALHRRGGAPLRRGGRWAPPGPYLSRSSTIPSCRPTVSARPSGGFRRVTRPSVGGSARSLIPECAVICRVSGLAVALGATLAAGAIPWCDTVSNRPATRPA